MPLKIFNRIFLSFIMFVVLILFVFWFFYFRDVTANTKERINRAVTSDALFIEKEVNQFFSLKRSQIGILAESAALKHFLHERGFLKTKVRGQLERDLIDFAANAPGTGRIRIVEPRSFRSEPTILDVKRHKANLADESFEETLKIVYDPVVKGRYEASYEYETLKGNPFILSLASMDDVAYADTKAGDVQYLSVGKAVKDRITGELTGILIIDLPIRYLRSYFYRPTQTYIENFAIRNAEEATIFEYGEAGNLAREDDVPTVTNYRLNLFGVGTQEVIAHDVGDLGMSLVVDVNVAKARNTWWRAHMFMYVMFAGFALISIIAAYLLSKSIATPIRRLNAQVAQVDEENPEPIAIHTKVAEIEHLTKTFNRFIEDLNRYKKESERKAHLAAIGQTTSMIAHDVRRPLAGIRAVLNILPEIKDDEATMSRIIAEVDRNVMQTNMMLNDILDFSRDSSALNVDAHNPQSIITAAVGDVLKDKGSVDVRFEYDFNHHNYLSVDGMRIIRLFSNIISNAIEAMQRKGRIWFRTLDERKDEKPWMKIAIGNDGPLIPPSVKDDLFDPFFTTNKAGGSGLGLAVCRKIVDMHGGRIYVDSSAPGDIRKTEFIVELPASEGRLEVDTSELIYTSKELSSFRMRHDRLGEKGRMENLDRFKKLHQERDGHSYLLIVDDEPLFRLSLRTLINNIPTMKECLTVVEADSAEKALELLGESAFEYVITDLALGKDRMDGNAFARRVLEKYPDTYIMMHSNKRRDELDESAMNIDNPRFMGFMPKPMKESDILQFLALKPFRVAREGEARRKKKVLVLNDDEALRIAFKIQLASLQAEMLEAEDVASAVDLLNNEDISLVLADINLGTGEPTGYDFLERVREDGNTVPIYMVSGLPAEEEQAKARERGADGYFQLPVSETMMEKIGDILREG